ncbi:MAG: type II toxin-antitoxin system RelE/ParE family toxin [Bergeyella sp.]
MAERLIWSPTAKKIRIEILKYWNERNKSKTYSKKLNILFEEGAQQIADFPYSGIRISATVFRGKLIRDYYLLYEFNGETVTILFIWDTRQNPSKLLEILGL